MRLSTLTGLTVCAALFAAPPALADNGDPAGTTLLHLSAASSVNVTPDQLVADLVATSTAASAAAAQRKVNALIADGTSTAHGVKNIDVRAMGYTVTPAADSVFSNGTPRKPSGWTAQQTLELRGTDGPALLDLVGKLQDKGFVTASLDWQLSTKLMRQSHDQASDAALKQLTARAKAAADALGLHVVYAKDIRLDMPVYQPRPVAMMAMKTSAAPSATAAPQDVSATVSGDYVLKP